MFHCLFEKDNVKKYDKTILLTCSEEVQRFRVLKREGWNDKRFLQVKKHQFKEKQKKSLQIL